jgi:type III restriction enzyme
LGTTITNPVINGPYDEPARHFVFDDDGITDEIADGRRRSEYFIPVPQTKKIGAQLQFDNEWTRNRIRSNEFVNDVRGRVEIWRKRGYPHVTPTTRRLLEYWDNPSRDNRVLFCQREAAETAIYLAEAAQKDGQGWMLGRLDEYAAEFNAGLPRIALKMATGSGKTVVMAMIIAWQTLNKLANPQDKRFARRFLVVAPGVTIRDRLRVLRPEHPGNYYRERDLVPADLMPQLSQAQIVITNFHVFLPKVTREGAGLSKVTKSLVLGGEDDPTDRFVESPRQVATRVARDFGLKSGEIVVLNDEAHHCYREKPDERVTEDLDADEKAEAKDREEHARVWFKGLQALQHKLGIKTIYDLSATPFFLSGSGYGEGTLFPWVVSDFSLVDAVECGIVKVPRLPVDDDSVGEQVVYRNLWDEISADLPKRAAKAAKTRAAEPSLPPKLESALYSLYANYAKTFDRWSEYGEQRGESPPVFIVVCNNTTVSKLVFDWIAGYDKQTKDLAGNDATAPCQGKLDLFSNVVADGEENRWVERPRTIIVDSAQLESGDQLSPEFRKLAEREIEELKDEIRRRHGDPDALAPDDLLREVMNTVGKPGKLGADIRCVVSVSMLTEGWDANTVTHILGVRAFRTPLLTEQVVGRGLRRRSYDVGDDGLFEPEYAEVFGVPFAFIPSAGAAKDPKPRRAPVAVRALPERADARIVFPRLIGYRLEMPDPELSADFTGSECRLRLTTDIVPTETHVGDITGYTELVFPEHLRDMREQEVAYRLAHRLLEREFRDELDNPRPWLYPKVLRVVKRWIDEAVDYDGGTYPGLLLLHDVTERAVEKIKHAIVAEDEREDRLLPVFDTPQDGSTDWVDFTTSRPAEPTDPGHCPVSHVVVDSGWELTVAKVLEELPGVAAYVKNDHLGFDVPYTYEGRAARYWPDFLVRLTDAGDKIVRTLIVEVSGGATKHHSPGPVAEKADTTRHLWVPAVNRHGGWGLWGYVEIRDPSAAASGIAEAMADLRSAEHIDPRTTPTSGTLV